MISVCPILNLIRKADAPDFSSAQSNSFITTVSKTEKWSENESYSEFSSKESQRQNGVKTRSYASRTNRPPINKSFEGFDSSHPSLKTSKSRTT